jgi:hypothetical protein
VRGTHTHILLAFGKTEDGKNMIKCHFCDSETHKTHYCEVCFNFLVLDKFYLVSLYYSYVRKLNETTIILEKFFVELKFELRASRLQSRHSTTWAISPPHFALVIRSLELFAWGGPKQDPSDLSLRSR